MNKAIVIAACAALILAAGCTTTETTTTRLSNREPVVETDGANQPVSDLAFKTAGEYDNELISKTIKRANYEFFNALMYADQSGWKGRIVGLLGFYPGTGPVARQYARNGLEFYFEGSYNGKLIGVIVQLDHPLPVHEAYGRQVPYIGPAQELMIFGSLRGTDNFMSDNGYTRALPILECLLIYDKDDFSLQRPLWISSKFEKLREGTVTVDSVKYELDKTKE